MFKYIQASWNAYKKNYLALISGLLIISLITIVIFSLGILSVAAFSSPEDTVTKVNDIILATENIALNPTDTSPLANLTYESFIFLFFISVAALVAMSLVAGYVGMLDEALRGRTSINIGKKTTLFEVTRKRGIPTIIVTILTYFIIWTTSLVAYNILLFMTPEWAMALSQLYLFLITLFLYLGVPATVLDKIPPVEAIFKSIRIVRRNFLSFFFLIFFYSLAYSLLFKFHLLGAVLTFIFLIPMFNLSVVKFYRDRK